MADKTEEPTDQRIEEARRQGQVIKSQEIRLLALLCAASAYFYIYGWKIQKSLSELLMLALNVMNRPFDEALRELLGSWVSVWSSLTFPIAAMMIAASVTAHVGQVGFLMATEAIQPNLNRFNPVTNFTNLFSLEKCIEFLKTLLKMALVTTVFYYLLSQYILTFQYLPSQSLSCGLALTTEVARWLLTSLIICFFLFAFGDYSFQRYRVMQSLRMTKEEIKQEFKNNEGDPEIKSRRRELHQEIQSGSLASQVKQSSVIVKNPTHVAVGLFYKRGETPLPQITVKGVDHQAQRILDLAERHRIPTVENVALARQLYRQGKHRSEIPEATLQAVAEVLRAVEQASSLHEEG